MKKLNLKTLITSKVNSWSELYQKFISIKGDENHSFAGKLFEEFAKQFFVNNGEYKAVYLYEEVPISVLRKLKLPKLDHGIDLVLVSKNNQFYGVQCKFRKNEASNLSWSKDKLVNLLVFKQLDGHIIFSNSSGVDKETQRQAKNFQKVLINDFLELSKYDFKSIRSRLNGKKTKKVIFKPKPHQNESIEAVFKGLKKHNRGKLILPCGAGKTLTSLWIKEKIKPKTTLVLVPSLALLRQIKYEWVKHKSKDFDYFCICSEKDIDQTTSDLPVGSVDELGFTGLGVSTDSKQIRSWMKSSKKDVVVFSTYQSSPMISKAKIQFDLAICDEAHKTATSTISEFAEIHFDKKIKCKKRLYMTATPRIVSDKIKDKLGVETYKYVADMANEETFGPTLYRMSFKDAIDKKILVDYKIIGVGVTDAELKMYIDKRNYIDERDIEQIANNVALMKIMKKVGATHAVSYHSSVKKAEVFAETYEDIDKKISVYHVNGKQSTSERDVVLNEFINKSKGLVTNARCLTEGVDVPAIDLVYFCDPKNSKVDIVQASGRALRLNKSKGKKTGYIVVPIFHLKGQDIEEQIENGAYKNLISVIRAMSDQDERLEDEIKKIIWGKGKRSKSPNKITIDLGLAENGFIQLEGLNNRLKESIFSEVIRKNVVSAWRPFELARKYARSLNLSSRSSWEKMCKEGKIPEDIPLNPRVAYLDKGWISTGDWLGTGNVATRMREYRNYEEAKKFVHKLKLKSRNEWISYCKGDLEDLPAKPDDIPANPNVTYKNKGWIGVGDFLGTGKVASHLIKFEKFEIAREFARSLKLESTDDWRKYCKGLILKNNPKPNDIPANPNVTYKNKGWIGMSDWLGIKNKSSRNRNFMSFKEAKEFALTLKLKSRDEWKDYCNGAFPNLPEKPDNIPNNPEQTYRKKGWKGVGDWLGTGIIAPVDYSYASFKVARKFSRKLKLNSSAEWKDYCKGNIKNLPKKPKNIPSRPERVYKNKGWKSFGDWLGTGVLAPKDYEYIAYSKALKFVQKLGIKTQKEWFRYCRGDIPDLPKKPNDIPSNPQRTYKTNGWVSWGEWLGSNSIASCNKSFLSFTKARDFVRKLGLKSQLEWSLYCNGELEGKGRKPENIPSGPYNFYKNRGWVSWADWFGK